MLESDDILLSVFTRSDSLRTNTNFIRLSGTESIKSFVDDFDIGPSTVRVRVGLSYDPLRLSSGSWRFVLPKNAVFGPAPPNQNKTNNQTNQTQNSDNKTSQTKTQHNNCAHFGEARNVGLGVFRKWWGKHSNVRKGGIDARSAKKGKKLDTSVCLPELSTRAGYRARDHAEVYKSASRGH